MSDLGTKPPRAMISVVLPIFNRESTLERAIDSVRAQLFEDWELLCVDDGSSDNSIAIVASYCEKDTRIKLFQIEHRGVAAARNKGLAAASGQIISYLDSDNRWRSNYLYDVWNALRGRVASSCYSAMRLNILGDDGQLIRQSILLQDFDRRRILRRNQIDMNTFSHSRDLLAAYGGFDEQMTRLCDWELILRYTSEHEPIRINSIGADYYHHRSKNRVSMNADYAPNRLIISLKSHPTLALRAVFVSTQAAQTLPSIFESAGFPLRNITKDEFADFELQASDIVFWNSCDWDSNQQLMADAAIKMEFDCCLSFYLLAQEHPASLINLSSFNRLHFVVCENPEHKREFEQYIRAQQQANNQIDVNPLDRVLLQENAKQPSLCLADFCKQIISHEQANPASGFDLWLDQSAAPQFIDTLTRVSTLLSGTRNKAALNRNDKAQISALGDGVTVYASAQHVPSIPAKAGLPRLLLLIGDDLSLSAEHIAQFDALLFDCAATAAAYAKEYPMLRTFCYESPTPQQLTRLIRTALGYLLQTRAMNLANHQLPRITFLAGNDGASSTRKRCYEMAGALRTIFPLQIVAQSKFKMRYLLGSDVVIIQRWIQRYEGALDDFFYAMGKLKLAGTTFVYDLDDYVLDYAQGLPKTFLSVCDRASASTHYLKDRLSRYNNSTYITANMIEVKNLNIPSLHKQRQAHRVICVSTDGLGYEPICAIAKKVHREFHQPVEFLFVSAVELPANKHVNCLGQLSWEQLFETMCSCELMLNLNEMSEQLNARLSGNGQLEYDREAFIHSKSAIKYHDSALAGIPLITSNAPRQFENWITQGETGIIVKNSEDMYEQLLNLLQHPEKAAQLARNARNDVFRNHTVAAHWESLAMQMLHSHQGVEKRAFNWHQEDAHTMNTSPLKQKDPAARYARMLELSSLGQQRAAQHQDQKRLLQIKQNKRKSAQQHALLERQNQHLERQNQHLERKIELREKQLENKEQIGKKLQSDLDLTLSRLSHYQQPFIRRMIHAIKFRLNKK